jgi:hypothetical protein
MKNPVVAKLSQVGSTSATRDNINSPTKCPMYVARRPYNYAYATISIITV